MENESSNDRASLLSNEAATASKTFDNQVTKKQRVLKIIKTVILVILRLALLCVFIALVVLGIIYRTQVMSYLQTFLQTVKNLGVWGILIYVAIYALATVAFIPGTILTLGCGFIYGLWIGVPVISIASLLGATLAFLLGRTLVRGLVSSSIKKYPKFYAIDKAIEHEGWKVVLLLRLIPLLPFNLLNYALALTKVPLLHYVLASWVGMFPGTCLYVYFGTSVRDLADIISGNISTTNNLYFKIAVMVLSGVLILGVFVLLVIIGKRAMTKYMKEVNEELEAEKQQQQLSVGTAAATPSPSYGSENTQ